MRPAAKLKPPTQRSRLDFARRVASLLPVSACPPARSPFNRSRRPARPTSGLTNSSKERVAASAAPLRGREFQQSSGPVQETRDAPRMRQAWARPGLLSRDALISATEVVNTSALPGASATRGRPVLCSTAQPAWEWVAGIPSDSVPPISRLPSGRAPLPLLKDSSVALCRGVRPLGG